MLIQARQLILQHGLTLSDLDRHPEVSVGRDGMWMGSWNGSDAVFSIAGRQYKKDDLDNLINWLR